MAVRLPIPKLGTLTNIGADLTLKNEEDKMNKKDPYASQRASCKANGGYWDEQSNTCILAEQKPKIEPSKPTADLKTGTITPAGQTPASNFITKSNEPRTYQGGTLTAAEFDEFKNKTIDVNNLQTSNNPNVQEAINQTPAGQQAIQAQQLGSQVGQFGELGVNPTGLNYGEAATAGLVGAIPRALQYGATAAAIGAAGGSVVPGVGNAAGAGIGFIAGFVGGITSSIISNFKSQRSDTTTAQQRVLDEGKQNLNDWATLVAADPSNAQQYVAEYNKQLALIDKAYRQMKLDTSRDLAKFETALPNLAEFEAFYSAAGERDFINFKMRQALGSPQNIDYSMIELANRRK